MARQKPGPLEGQGSTLVKRLAPPGHCRDPAVNAGQLAVIRRKLRAFPFPRGATPMANAPRKRPAKAYDHALEQTLATIGGN